MGVYLVLAVAFGFMLHVRKRKPSEIFGSMQTCSWKTYRWFCRTYYRPVAVFALLAGTATTFSVATPLMANNYRRCVPYIA